jgi:hypothetical protein
MHKITKIRYGWLSALLAAVSFGLLGCGSEMTSARKPELSTSEKPAEERPKNSKEAASKPPQPIRQLPGRDEAVNVGN